MRLRIVSPRWDAPENRFRIPGEIVEVPDEEFPHWAAHTELAPELAPPPVGEPAVPPPPPPPEPELEPEPDAEPDPDAHEDDGPPYECPRCDRTFGSSRGLKAHVRQAHDDDKE